MVFIVYGEYPSFSNRNEKLGGFLSASVNEQVISIKKLIDDGPRRETEFQLGQQILQF